MVFSVVFSVVLAVMAAMAFMFIGMRWRAFLIFHSMMRRVVVPVIMVVAAVIMAVIIAVIIDHNAETIIAQIIIDAITHAVSCPIITA